jgi:cell wall-associated NlpC family hydrolase
MKRLSAVPVAVLLVLSIAGTGVGAASSHARPALTSIQTHLVQTALQQQGAPYANTNTGNPGNSPATGFSDVGFVDYVYQQVGITLPADREALTGEGKMLTRGQLRPGDLVFFQNTTWYGLSHVAIYLGHGTFIHAEWYGVGVRVSSFRNDSKDGSYWHAHFLYGVRAWTMQPVHVITTVSRP